MGNAISDTEKKRNYGKEIDELTVVVSKALDNGASRTLQQQLYAKVMEAFHGLKNNFSKDLEKGLFKGDDNARAALEVAFGEVNDALTELERRLDSVQQPTSAATGPVQQAPTGQDENKEPTSTATKPGDIPDTEVTWKYTPATYDPDLHCYTRRKYQGISPLDGEIQYHPHQPGTPAEDSPQWGSLDAHPDLKKTAEENAAKAAKLPQDWTRMKEYAAKITSKEYAEIKEHIWSAIGQGSTAGNMSVSNNAAVANCADYLMTGGKASLKEKLASHGWDLDDPGVLQAVAFAIQDVLNGGTRTGVTGYSSQMENFYDETDYSKAKY